MKHTVERKRHRRDSFAQLDSRHYVLVLVILLKDLGASSLLPLTYTYFRSLALYIGLAVPIGLLTWALLDLLIRYLEKIKKKKKKKEVFP